jgi:hypothetical protein
VKKERKQQQEISRQHAFFTNPQFCTTRPVISSDFIFAWPQYLLVQQQYLATPVQIPESVFDDPILA